MKALLNGFHLNDHNLGFYSYRLKSYNHLVQHKTLPQESTAQ